MRQSIMSKSIVLLALLLWLAACSQKPAEQTEADASATDAASSAADASKSGDPARAAAAPKAEPIVVPEGKTLVVRLDQAVGSKISRTGDTFTATIAKPVQVNGKTVIPAGAEATGTVVDAKPLGRFKGGASLRIKLESISVDGKNYDVQTSAVSRSAQGKGKRSAGMIGGGAGAGAVIGAIAGGGKGAAIGAAAGAGAGTAGAAFTGNKDIVLPAESTVSFRLTQPLEIK
jgi:hypothetical protein